MKKVAFLFVIMLLSLPLVQTMQAQQPFLVEGKKWNYYMNGYGAGAYYYCFFVSGDTIVGNMACKKLYRQKEGGAPSLYAVLFEDANGVVSTVEADGTLELLYDFSLKVGSKVSNHTSYFDYDYTVTERDTIENCGRQYSRLVLEAEFNPNRHVTWTESIGVDIYSIVHNGLAIMNGDYSILLSCEVDGEMVYCTHEFKAPLLVDGKEWTYRRGDESTGYEYMRQTVEGDTLIGSHTWKKVYIENPLGAGKRYEKAMREDSLTVFELREDGQERLFLDFGLKFNEQFRMDDSDSVYAVVIPGRFETSTLCGIERQQVKLALYMQGAKTAFALSCWTEAIGGCGIYRSFPREENPVPDWELFTCKEGGKSIFRLVDDESLESYELTAEEERQLAEQSNGFAFRLFGQTRGEESQVLSPLSVTYALSLLNNGAAGQTRQEISQTLGFGDFSMDAVNAFCHKQLAECGSRDSLTQVSIANGVWVNLPDALTPSFIETATNYYDASIENRDFEDGQTMDVINQWASDHTNGMIPEVLNEDSFNPAAASYLLNAVYFKGTWTTQFDKTQTKDEPFGQSGRQVPMMHMLSDMSYAENGLFKAIRMPYGNQSYVMTVLLPQDGKTLSDVLSALEDGQWNQGVAFDVRTVDIKLPRVDVRSTIPLKDVMMNLGIASAFKEYAEFPDFCLTPTFVSDMSQCARIKLDEEGTEAAAVTVIEMTDGEDEPSMPVDFHADRPFLYVISEKSSGLIYFIGQMTDGQEEAVVTSISSKAPVPSVTDADAVYDLQGRRLDGVPQRGVYIRDGRKVVVK